MLFDNDAINPELWGLYFQFKIGGDAGKTELYYLGFQSDRSRFNDVVGEETRHTIGLRRFGKLGERWHYNTELVYQFGDLAGQDIRAYNIETDWRYELIHTRWQPSIGLKLELTSGDNRAGDGKINSFNPMLYADFVILNKDYFSISAADIKTIRSVLTVVDGDIVFGAEEYIKLSPKLPEILPEWSPVKHFGSYWEGNR